MSTPMPEKPTMGGQPLTRELASAMLSIEFTDTQWAIFTAIISEERSRAVEEACAVIAHINFNQRRMDDTNA
jgi:hypothetical protein